MFPTQSWHQRRGIHHSDVKFTKLKNSYLDLLNLEKRGLMKLKIGIEIKTEK